MQAGISRHACPSLSALDVHSWPIIEWSAHRIQHIALLHLASRCDAATSGPGAAAQCGSTLWCGLVAPGLVGLTWPWQQIAPEVLVVADPMAIRSNLRWLGDDGHVLGALAAARLHTRLVVRLRWGQSVRRAVRAALPAPVLSWPSPAVAHG